MPTYATLEQLYQYGAPQKAFGQLTDDTKSASLDSASAIVDTYYRGRFSLPLISWDIATTRVTCQIAAYDLLVVRGYNPAAGADVNLLDRYNSAISWLKMVQKQQAHPDVVPQPNNTPAWNQPEVISSSVVNVNTGAIRKNRGW